MSKECGKRDRPLGRNTRKVSKHSGKQQGRLRPTWNEIWQGMSKTIRRTSSSTSAANGGLGKMWGNC